MPPTSARPGPRGSTAPGASYAPRLPGRRGQAARNDELILEAARAVFLEDAKAPIAAVAERAGVGISALYRRYPSKEHLLRRICHDGLRLFIAEAEAAGADPDAWRGFTRFLERVVDADVHSLTVHLAGTFTPTAEMWRDAERANVLAARLVKRAHAGGRLRRDATLADVTLVLEGCAAIRVPEPDRAKQLRRRHLALLVAGLATRNGARLPGPAPKVDELNWRWHG